jgi:hypothetical protein
MATRIIRFKVSLNAGQSNNGQGGNPAPFVIQTPTGFQRTIVEVRPFGDQPFEYQGNYDTELYHDIDSDDINTYHRPHYVGLVILTTHQYSAIMTNNGTATGNFGVDIVVEETTAPAGAAPGA